MAKLEVVVGDLGRKEFPVASPAVIGRTPECDVMIPRGWISRQHARITRRDGCWFIEDLGTRNGTIVNGRKVTKALLCDGDRVTIADCELVFRTGDAGGQSVRLDEGETTITESVSCDEPAEADLHNLATVRKLKTHLGVLKQVAETACGELELQNVLRRILDRLLAVYPQAKHVHVLVFGMDEGGRDLHVSASRDPGDAGPGMSRTLLEIVAADRRAVLAGDAGTDARMEDAQSIRNLGLRSLMCSPLIVRGRMLGAIQVDTTDVGRQFGSDDLHALVTVAGQVAIAAENADLIRRAVQQERLAAVGQTMSSLAHCMKNVVNCIKGGAYILDSGIEKHDDEKVRKGWEMVRRNTGFLSDLVMDMLAYCRKEGATREVADIGPLLDSTGAMVRESAARKGVETTVVVAEGLPQLKLDAVGLKRAILNLLSNAVDACAEGGHVRLAAEGDAQRGEVCITVKDDGQGMPEDVQRRLFEPFFTTKGSRGTGLGLALVKKVVDEHGGRIRVESEIGKGAAFFITLPIAGA